jgi:hypothetical protein
VAVFASSVAMAVVVCVTVVVRVRVVVGILVGGLFDERLGVVSQETSSIGSA